jgi:stress response protein YsnF
MKTVVGVFDDVSGAKHALSEMTRLGVTDDSVGILTGNRSAASETMRTIDLPELGPVVANKTMLEWLANPSGIVGAMFRLGVSRQQADRYVTSIKAGRTLEAAIVPDGRENEVSAVMQQHRTDRSSPRDASAAYDTLARRPGEVAREVAREVDREKPMRAVSMGEDIVIPILEEELEVETREIDAGGVHVSTHVRTEPVTREVLVHEEHVHVQRRRSNRPVSPREKFDERHVELHATRETPVVSKRARVVEEIRVHKESYQHEERVTDEVRRTRADVSDIAGEPTRRTTPRK